MNKSALIPIISGWVLLAWEKGEDEHHFDVLAFATKDRHPIITDKELKLTRGYHKWVVLDCEMTPTRMVRVTSPVPLRAKGITAEFIRSIDHHYEEQDDDFLLMMDFRDNAKGLQETLQDAEQYSEEELETAMRALLDTVPSKLTWPEDAR